MTKVSVSKSINVSATQAWEKLASFRGIEEFSPIARSVVEGEGVGAKRTCYMPDDARIDERLSKLDHANMQFEYVIISGPFPITDYVSTVKVEANGEHDCQVTWTSEFNVAPETEAEITGLFEGFYNVIIESLEALINNQN